ncbi:ATP-binding protein [Geobacter sulfurreducens]|uniref:ATP-binding protein n=1 Tax=Geobacter sulfurreducens TaxID=35554 RepID=UPI0005D95B48|nr:ATP-binding protein [Geobacter sulfurreducens]AJY71005.1 histidine kinase [Geobacter sulfurreducens]UTG93960.1 response regulator [Geobacter sulfurreducens]
MSTATLPHTVGKRLFRQTLLLALALSVVFSAVFTVVEYYRSKVSLNESVELLKKTHLDAITAALWSLDRQQIAAQIDGIHHYPFISYVAVVDQGGVVVESGTRSELFGDVRRIDLTATYNGRQVSLGSLYLEIDRQAIMRDALSTAAVTLLFQTLTITIVMLFTFMLFERQVTRHLAAAADYFTSFGFARVQQPLQLDKHRYGDEIDALVEAFNRMRESLAVAYQQQQGMLQAVRESEALLRAIARRIPNGGVWVVDTDGRYIMFEGSLVESLGLSGQEALGRMPGDLFGEPLADRLVGCYRLALAGGTLSEEIEYRERVLWIQFAPLEDEHGAVMAAVALGIDVTERRQAEAERREMLQRLGQAHKMEAVGRLAGGIAHDYNNKLTVILGYAHVLKLTGFQSKEAPEQLDQIIRAAEHSRDITRQLLAFTRSERVNPVRVDLNRLISQSSKSLTRLIGEDITLSHVAGADLWPVRIDPTQADQLLMNLVMNARDAIAGTGSVTIATSNVVLDRATVRHLQGASPGEYVLMTVSDTGCGMDPEVMEHIFEPFYTTKEMGKGTGLGLATVYGIVRQNGGAISVESEPGGGSVFSIYLPRFVGESHDVRRLGEVDETLPARTTLLVDDDDAVRDITALMLRRLGHTVITASDPDEAIHLCQQPGIVVDLILTDVIMPSMNGREMVRSILSHQKAAKVLYMSGYPADVVEGRGAVDADARLLRKPFALDALREHIGKAMLAGT